MSKWHTRSYDTHYTVGHWDQLRSNYSASGTVQQTPTFPDVKLCFTTRQTIVVSSGTFTWNKKIRHRGKIFLIVIFPTGTTNKKTLSNSWQVNHGVQNSYIHTFTCELSTMPPDILPFCKWPIFKVVTQEKLHHHCTRILQAQCHLKWRSHLEVLSAIKKKTC